MRPAVPEVERHEEESIVGSFSRRALLLTAGAAGGLAAVPLAGRMFRLGDALGSPSKAQDARILQLVLQLERTQVAFYEQALKQAGLTGDLHDFAQAALGHERQHLAAIRSALGAKAGPKPTFEFGKKTRSAKAFTQAAIQLEDIAVAGYNGQATNLTKGTLASAAEIVSVEARHAAWVRAIAGEVAAPDAVDKPMTAQQVAAGLRGIGLRA
jgi:Ferritin-like domain